MSVNKVILVERPDWIVDSIKIVVPISTGKDSQACLKLALETYKPCEIIGVFCDTKWEHPLSYQHLEKIKNMYGVHIETIGNSSVEKEVLKLGRFPNALARFCTDRLKINTSKAFYRYLATELDHGFEVWLGMRSDESTKRKTRFSNKVSNELYTPHEINSRYPNLLTKMGISFKLPILEWSTPKVFDYVGLDNLNPLYKSGFERVGCFPCLASSSQKHQNALNFDSFGAEQTEKIISLEAITGVKHEPANTDQICMFCTI